MHANCLNCGATLQPEQQFCMQCGQSAHLHRINGGYLLHEAVHYFTHADKGIFFLLKSLATKPGEAARQYIAGQRRKYFAPLTFFLLAAGIMVFGVKMSTENLDASLAALQLKAGNVQDPSALKALGMQVRGIQAQRFMSQYSNMVSMIATPLLVLLMWLFYRRQPYNYMEHLVANLYFVGFTSLFYGLLFAPLMKLSGGGGLFRSILMLYFVFEIVYRSLSYYYFMPARGRTAALKAFGVSLFASLFWAALSYSLIYAYVAFG